MSAPHPALFQGYFTFMLFRILTQRWIQVLLLLLLLAGALVLRFKDPRAVEQLRNMIFDHYNNALPRKAGNQVVIIDIDEESLRRHGQWPWPRQLMGDIPVALAEMGALSTAFDVVFAEPDRTSPAVMANNLPATPELKPVVDALRALPDNDAVFAEKISRAGNVVMGFVAGEPVAGRDPALKASLMTKGGNPADFVTSVRGFTTPLPVLSDVAAGSGGFMVLPGKDGVIRRVPMLMATHKEGTRDVYPSLALEAVRVATMRPFFRILTDEKLGIQELSTGEYKVPVDEHGNLWVYYTGHRKEIYIPAWKVLARQVDPALIKDKIAFVGTSAPGLLDLRASPLDRVLPGVEVHAEIAEQILNNQYLMRPNWLEGAELLTITGIGIFIIFLSPFIGTGALALFCGVLGTGGYFGGLYAYQNYGLLLDPVYPMLSITVIFIVSSILTNLRSEAEKRAIRDAFGHYISPELLEELTEDPTKLKLGGEVRELSVMFTDIRNFTTISESMEPGELIRMMNDFLTPMTSAVLENRGTVDKYMGDAMMTFWNAPVDDPHHAMNACKAALEMVSALKPVNDMLQARAVAAGRVFHELKAGIGINSGRASVGNMGSKQRFAYSALGDTVNLASRMEGQTKAYGVSVMISDETRRQAGEFAVLELDLLTVKGRSEPERVFALLGSPEEAKGVAFRDLRLKHNDMLAAYRARNWDAADDMCEACKPLRPDMAGFYRLYQTRIAAYRANPPPAGWDGVYVAKDK